MSTVATDAAALVAEKRREFAARNPESARLHDEARRVLPGGHTRASIAHEPFPLTFVRGENSVLVDADGHEYVDLLGDFTAGCSGTARRASSTPPRAPCAPLPASAASTRTKPGWRG